MRIKWITAFIAAVVLILGVSPAGADTVRAPYQAEDTGSILIDYKDDPDGLIPIAGAVFNAYRIASLNDQGEYISLIEGAEGPELYTDADMIIATVKDHIKNGEDLFAYRVTTDKEGLGCISPAEEGLYVIEEAESAGGYLPSQPFLVSIPYMDDGKWQYDVTVQPKPNPVGSLIVKKTVRGRKADKDREFHFKVMLEDYDGEIRWEKNDGTKGWMKESCVITLKTGEEAVFYDIPVGCAYSVEEKEADRDGYITTSSGRVGTIKRSERCIVSFINTSGVPETGDSYIAIISGIAAAAFLMLAVLFLRKAGKREKR